MKTTMLSVVEDDTSPKEGDPYCWEGDQKVYVVVKQGVAAITSPVMFVYRGSADKTSTCTTGNLNATLNQVVLKTLTNLLPGEYTIRVAGYCDGQYFTFCAFTLHVRKKHER